MGREDGLSPMVTLNTNGKRTRESRVKLCSVPLTTIAALMQMDGQHSYKFEGWPKDCRIIGARIKDNPGRVEFVLYHPEFPIVLGEPEHIKITARKVS